MSSKRYMNWANSVHLLPIFIIFFFCGCKSTVQIEKTPTEEIIQPNTITNRIPTMGKTIKVQATTTVCQNSNPRDVFLNAEIDKATPSGRRNFYFDSINGNDGNSGENPDQAWSSLIKLNETKFLPGDVINLKRGSSWTGTFIINASGTDTQPIIFTTYGEKGDLPIFRNPWDGKKLTVGIWIKGNWIILEKIKVKEAQLAGIYIDERATNNIVRNVEATQVGEGINVHGESNKIINNYIHDLTMVINTEGGDDDYGAVGIWLFNSNNEVAYNSLINCRAPSYDYGEDGGAVEFYSDVNNSYIHHNYANNTQGFIEIGGGSAYDNIVAYNLIVNSGKLLGFHLGGKFASQVMNFRFENNTVVNTTSEVSSAAINLWWGSPNPEMLIMRNNIFYLKNFKGLVYSGGNSSNFTHDHNIYYMPEGNLGIKTCAGEIKADPDFVNLDCGDYRLKSTSPALDAGLNLGYTLDFLNNPVFIEKASDIGAFEYQGK
jgi:hypothetical protein